jgi:hypothetical protein
LNIQKEQIAIIVREVLQEFGLNAGPPLQTASKRIKRPCPSPAVLNVFHPGVRYLDLALEQVRQIESMAGKSSVFTVPSARAWVCGQDVKKKSGCKCILDTVKPEGLEKTLYKADILVLPTFCFKTAAKAARLIDDSPETAVVISALMQGKPVLAANDGFSLLNTLSNEGIRQEIQRIIGKLEKFGMVFCKTEKLASVFKKVVPGRQMPGKSVYREDANSQTTPAPRLITARDIQTAVDDKQSSIPLAPGGIITPLAKDLAREYAIRIDNQGE